MTILQSVILGIVEGATEFLPISSTGHLILVSQLIGVVQNEFSQTFEISIQLGAVCAIVALYARSFFDVALLKKLAVAFIPTGIIGLVSYPILKTYLLGNNAVVLASLCIGGIALIFFERRFGKLSENTAPTVATVSYRQAALIGLFQAVAIIPGVSRSGATVVGGMLLGIARPTIVEFSFLLAVPTILVATGFSLIASGMSFAGHDWLALGIGFFISFAVAIAAVRWLLEYIRRHSFAGFGIYRILFSAALAAFLFL